MPRQDDETTVIGQTKYRFQVPHEKPETVKHHAENLRAIDRVINGLPLPLEPEIPEPPPTTIPWFIISGVSVDGTFDIDNGIEEGSFLLGDGSGDSIIPELYGAWQVTCTLSAFSSDVGAPADVEFTYPSLRRVLGWTGVSEDWDFQNQVTGIVIAGPEDPFTIGVSEPGPSGVYAHLIYELTPPIEA
jgi:hypothetical protein